MREQVVVERRERGNVRLLFIVARDRLGLYDYLSNHFSQEKEVRVILDRRRTERRESFQPYEPDRRGKDRRREPTTDNYLRSLGYMIAR
ncbi:MAG: hypothetical protein HYS14_08065 [Candidatus Rokubacteria bacterium]|nr:hypothetical protein [Candidatus Rokubacteria bacterium]